MPSTATSLIITEVEKTTGYRVTVTQRRDLQTHASMMAARPENPYHVVLINPKYDKASNYLVALQCLMLLEKWDNDGNVYDFAISNVTTERMSKEAAKRIKADIPERSKQQIGKDLVNGLLQQLNSMPCEMLVAERSYIEYPSLRNEQDYIIREELGLNKSGLSATIKATMPTDIFDKNAIMNAAFALWWDRLTEKTQSILPYKTMGYYSDAAKLVDLFDKARQLKKGRYQQLVNLWGEQLSMTDCYEWIVRKG